MRIAMTGRLNIMEFMEFAESQARSLPGAGVQFPGHVPPPLSYPLNMAPEAKFGLVADFSQRHAAIAAGLGSWGRPQSGHSSKTRLHGAFSRLCFAMRKSRLIQKFTEDLCTQCNICVEKLPPAHALDEEGKTHEMKCLKHSPAFRDCHQYGVSGGNLSTARLTSKSS